jgi:heme-degrading monooxygenase HmoA
MTDEGSRGTRRPCFVGHMAPNGEWVRFFRRGSGYLGSELLRDERDERRYLTIDRWASRAAYDAFRAGWQAEYHALDGAYDLLTEQET